MAHQPPLSPRLHSLPDNVLSPLGLLAEASLQNTDHAKKQLSRNNGNAPHRPSPLSLTAALNAVRNGTNQRTQMSDVRGSGEDGVGVASSNYFKAGVSAFPSTQDERLPELLSFVSREEIDELFEHFFSNMATHVPLLLKDFHTPDLVLQRSQFLCTV